MEKYSKAVSEMYSQFEKREAHPMAKYIGKSINYRGGKTVVVGYNDNELADEPLLIIDASQAGGWSVLEPYDVIFKECESYWYASIADLKTEDYGKAFKRLWKSLKREKPTRWQST